MRKQNGPKTVASIVCKKCFLFQVEIKNFFSKTYCTKDSNVSFIPFLFFVFSSLGDEVTKILKYWAIFVYILQGKMGKSKRKSRNWSDQNTKNQKTEIWDEGNNCFMKISWKRGNIKKIIMLRYNKSHLNA